METEQLTWQEPQGWQGAQRRIDAGLVLYFGSNEALQTGSWLSELANLYPNAHIVGCFTTKPAGRGTTFLVRVPQEGYTA